MPQDSTAFVALQPNALESAATWITVSTWVTVSLLVVLAGLLAVMVLVLVELRKLSQSWNGFVEVTTRRTQPMLDHVTSAARNLDKTTVFVRDEVERATQAVGGITLGMEEASAHVRTRLAELSALLDFAQSEAEEAVLEAAAKVRAIRAGTGLLRRAARRRPPKEDKEDTQEGEVPASEVPASEVPAQADGGS